MKSESYPHKIAAVYPDRAAAEIAVSMLELEELGDITVTRLAPGARFVDLAVEPESEAARDNVTKQSVAGSALGTAAGAAIAGTTAAIVPTLFVSAPVVGPLIILGYGAMVGASVGALRGLRLGEDMLASLVRDALDAGYHVVIVHAATTDSREHAQTVIDETMNEQYALS